MSVVVAFLSGGLTFMAALIVLTTQRRALVRQRITPYVGETAVARTATVRFRANRQAGLLKSLVMRSKLEGPAARLIDRSGAEMSPEMFVLAAAATAAFAFLVVLLAGGGAGALVAALVGGCVPWVVLEVKGRRRTRAFERQLPEILDTLGASLRAGHGFDQALQSLSVDIAEPAGRELRRVVAALQLGRSVDESLGELGNRIKSEDLQFVLDAVMIQRQVGGSLASLFELVSHTVRSREEFRRKVRALTSLPRTSANVLTVLPFLAALGMTFMNKRYMAPLWHTSLGHILIGAGLGMMVCGGLVLRRIGSVRG
jgi:tight adherence protein B